MEELVNEPYTFDGVLIKACASHKRFVPRDGSDKPPEKPERRFQKQEAQTTAAPDHRPGSSEGNESRLLPGAGIDGNRNGRLVDGETTQARGTADFVQAIREAKLKPLVAAKKSGLADGRTTWPAG